MAADFKVTLIDVNGRGAVSEVRGAAGAVEAVAWLQQLLEERLAEVKYAGAVRTSPPEEEVPSCGH